MRFILTRLIVAGLTLVPFFGLISQESEEAGRAEVSGSPLPERLLMLPLISAPTGPERVRPKDPGGMPIPNRDSLLLNRDEGTQTPRILPVDALPDTPDINRWILERHERLEQGLETGSGNAGPLNDSPIRELSDELFAPESTIQNKVFPKGLPEDPDPIIELLKGLELKPFTEPLESGSEDENSLDSDQLSLGVATKPLLFLSEQDSASLAPQSVSGVDYVPLERRLAQLKAPGQGAGLGLGQSAPLPPDFQRLEAEIAELIALRNGQPLTTSQEVPPAPSPETATIPPEVLAELEEAQALAAADTRPENSPFGDAPIPYRPQPPLLDPELAVQPYAIQLAAFRDEVSARKEGERLQNLHPQLLADMVVHVIRADLGKKGVYYRLRLGPVPNLATAQDLCALLKARGQDCLPAGNK